MLFNKLFILTTQINFVSKYQCACYIIITKDDKIIIITKSKYSWIITHYLVNCLFLQFNSSLTTNRTGYRLTVM